jgi:hypothetical protein
MKLVNLNKRSLICVTLSFALAACTTSDKYSFLHYGRTPAANATNLETPVLSDQLALLYASNVATILRSRFTGARITREISSSLQVILAGLAGAGAALNFGETTLAVLGLGSAAIPEFQGIFNAKGRAECYQDAVRLIEEAQIEYLAHNQRPSSDELTQNGVTLFQRVTASIHVVEKTLVGHLPSVEDMQKATERMTSDGAVATEAGAPAFNNRPANADSVTARGRYEGPIASTKVAISEVRTNEASIVRLRNNLRARIVKLTDAAAQVMLAAGREHADLKSHFVRTPPDGLPPRNYLFRLIETGDEKELKVWGSIIPVRPVVAATPAPSPTESSLPPP